MRLLQTLVSSAGFRELTTNVRRTELFREVLHRANAEAADVVVLPGGYWTVRHFEDVEPLAMRLASEAATNGIALIAGIDVQSAHGKKAKGAAHPVLPFFGFVGRVGTPVPRVWRQTSDNNENAQEILDDEVPGAHRVVPLGTQSVGVLICGELFSWRARQLMADLSPTLVVDLGHVGMGTGVTRSMERIAVDGRSAVAHSQHVKPDSQASLHFVNATGVRQSTPISECAWVGDDDFWIAYRSRDIPSNIANRG